MRWKYRTVFREMQPKAFLEDVDNEDLTAMLNQFGADGWELVSTPPIAAASNLNMNSQTRGLFFVFRRPVD